jgi:hypothetical protein
MPSAPAATSRLAWHGLVIDHPVGWEITAFRLDPHRSEFRFHERLDPVATLNLVRMEVRADVPALAAELFARQDGLAAGSQPTLSTQGIWTVAHRELGEPWLALAWHAQECRVLHWAFPAWRGIEPGWQALLDSLRAGPGDIRGWQLFGAAAQLPRAYLPREVEAQPGAVRIDFVAAGWTEVTARRYGMAALRLEERPLSSWLQRSLLASHARIEQMQETTRHGLPAVRALFSVRGERPLDRVAWRRWPGEAWWWHDAAANRIYGLEQVGPPAARRVELSHA